MSMHSLQDLRDTLDTHAAGVRDDAVHARSTAVRARARVVRRRRNVAVAGAVAAVVAAVSVVSVLPGERDLRPSDRELIGKQAPETLDSYGYGYRFVEGVEGEGKRVSIRLPESDRPRLLSWAAEDGAVTVGTPYGGNIWSDRTDFDDFTLLQPEESGKWVLRTDGGPGAFAVYELDEQAPGVRVDDMTFREHVADEDLVDIVVGEPGQTEVSLDVTLPRGAVRIVSFCDGVRGDIWANTSIGADGPYGSGGCSDGGFDPSGSAGGLFDRGELGRPGDTLHLRSWVSRTFDGRPISHAPDARLGIAVYRQPEPVTTIAGWDVAPTVEHEGHTWQFVDVVRADPGERFLRVDNTTDGPLLVDGSFRAPDRSRVEFRAGAGSGVDRVSEVGNGSGLLAVLRPDGPPATLRVRGDRPMPANGALGFALYQRVD